MAYAVMYYLYILRSTINADLYVGHCEDLRKRFSDHNSGRVKSTKAYRPWGLIYYEAYKHKKDVTAREKQLKDNHKAKEDLKIQINNSLI